MAVDKLVDSAQLDSDLKDVADAIRAKSGGESSLAFPSGFISEIGNISSGGSLPSVISKIDGGSFTLASDTAGTKYWISHSLGVLPKQITIWTEDNDLLTSMETSQKSYLLCSNIHLINWVSGSVNNGAFPQHLFRNTNGATGNTGSALLQSSIPDYFTSTQFNNALAAVSYKAGVQYKWLAWA